MQARIAQKFRRRLRQYSAITCTMRFFFLLVGFLCSTFELASAGPPPQPVIDITAITRNVTADSEWSIQAPKKPGDQDGTPQIFIESMEPGVFQENAIQDDGFAYTEARQNTRTTGLAISGSGYARAALSAPPYRGAALASSNIPEILFTVPVESNFVLEGSFEMSGTGDPGVTSGNIFLLGTQPEGLISEFITPETPEEERSFRFEGTAPADSLIVFAFAAGTQREINPDSGINQPGDWEISFEFRLTFVDVELVGLEVVQVVQDWHNAILLVQDRETIVRAHLQNEGSGPVRPLLRGFRDGGELPGSPLSADNLAGRVQPPDDAQEARADLLDNAYFRLPQDWTTEDEPVELLLELEDEGPVLGCSEIAGPVTADCRTTVEFDEVAPLKLKLVRISWDDQNGVTQAPSNATLVGQARELLNRFPLKNISLTTSTLHFAGGAPSDDVALDAVRILRLLNDCDASCNTYYYGIAVNGTFAGSEGVAEGIGEGGSAVGEPDLAGTSAHEIGHLFGRPHSTNPTIGPGGLRWELGACCSQSSGSDFPSFLFEDVGAADKMCPGISGGITAFSQGRRPTLGEMDDGSDLLVFGYHQQRRRVVNPEQTFDLMSYCQGVFDLWPSRYTYQQLFTELQVPGLRQSQGPADFLVVSGVVDFALDTAQINSADRFTGISAPPPGSGSYLLRTRDDMGIQLSEIPFEPTPEAVVDGDDFDAGFFIVYVPDDPAIHEFEIEESGMVLTSLSASDNPPTIEVLSPNGGEIINGDTLEITWTSDDLDGDPLTATVQHSPDNGTTWNTLAVGIGGESLEVSRSALAGSANALVRVMVSDGFHQASDVSNGVFSVADNLPMVLITSPHPTLSFWTGQLINFEAVASDPEDGPLTGASLQWTSDIDGAFGEGESLEISAASLTPGLHMVTLTGTDSNAGQSSAEQMLLIVDPDNPSFILSDGFEDSDQ